MSPSSFCSSSGIIFNVLLKKLEIPKLIIISYNFCKSRVYKLSVIFKKLIPLEALKDVTNSKDLVIVYILPNLKHAISFPLTNGVHIHHEHPSFPFQNWRVFLCKVRELSGGRIFSSTPWQFLCPFPNDSSSSFLPQVFPLDLTETVALFFCPNPKHSPESFFCFL